MLLDSPRLTEIPAMEESWAKFKRDNSITSRTCPNRGELSYARRYWAHISGHERWAVMFSSWEDFDNAKTFLHWLQKNDLWSDFKSLFGEMSSFSSKTMPNKTLIFYMFHGIYLLMANNFEDITKDADTTEIYTVEFCKLCAPMTKKANTALCLPLANCLMRERIGLSVLWALVSHSEQRRPNQSRQAPQRRRPKQRRANSMVAEVLVVIKLAKARRGQRKIKLSELTHPQHKHALERLRSCRQ